MSSINPPVISILICVYNMQRELPRTLYTLSSSYQKNLDGVTCELVVLDNGSTPAVDVQALRAIVPAVRVIRPDVCLASPARAINAAMRQLRGQLLGLWIDGARLASPGIVCRALEAWRADASRAIGTLAFHLGPDVQMRSVFDGYDAATEDALLASVPWRQDGYRLFDIAVLAGSSAPGWFGCIKETNGFFADRALWTTLGGLDERFKAPGGGFVNLDLWQRAVDASQGQPWMILGEGTFHQVHGGVATNGTDRARGAMAREYEVIHGSAFEMPAYQPRFVGTLDDTRYMVGAPRPLDGHRQVHSVRGRAFRVGLGHRQMAGIQAGTLRTTYKGLRLAKSPLDLALYLQVIQRHRPRTIIEVGTSEGGSASWFLDQCRALGLIDTRVISIDRSPPTLTLEGVSFHQGDANDPASTFPHEALAQAPHPWLVVEDSAHTHRSTSSVLDYFDQLMGVGDRIVVEDGVVADLEGDHYRLYDDGPNRAVSEFLAKVPSRYDIDVETCDFYGRNVTYSPNGWLIRRV